MAHEQRQMVQAALERVRRLENEARYEAANVARLLEDEELQTFVAEQGGRSSSDAYYEQGCEALSDALELALERMES